MTAQKSKHNNFWHGLLIGLFPIFIFSLLIMLTRAFLVFETSDQEIIVQAIEVTIIVAIFFCGGIYFAYFYHHLKLEKKLMHLKDWKFHTLFRYAFCRL